VALGLLFEEYAAAIHLNDLARPIYAFWHAVLNDTETLCKRIKNATVTMNAWRRHRKVYERREDADLDDLAFSTLFLNRTNRSGILAGGVIGGKAQDGKWKLDVRFNKENLTERIRKIARYKDRIRLTQLDALAFINSKVSKLGKKAFIFFDPPYIEHSSHLLYLNNYDLQGHRDLESRIIRLKQPWIVTYDYAAVKNRLYAQQRRAVYLINYTAHMKHAGREAMFFSDRLELPKMAEALPWRTKLLPYQSRLNRREPS